VWRRSRRPSLTSAFIGAVGGVAAVGGSRASLSRCARLRFCQPEGRNRHSPPRRPARCRIVKVVSQIEAHALRAPPVGRPSGTLPPPAGSNLAMSPSPTEAPAMRRPQLAVPSALLLALVAAAALAQQVTLPLTQYEELRSRANPAPPTPVP